MKETPAGRRLNEHGNGLPWRLLVQQYEGAQSVFTLRTGISQYQGRDLQDGPLFRYYRYADHWVDLVAC